MPYHVYILASRPHGTLYVGVTKDLTRRLEEHRLGLGSQFAKQYRIRRLVHVETFDDPESAIVREKRLKKWNREWKIQLIEENNPHWADRASLLG